MHPDAELRLPAETAYVSVLRMAAAGIAARLDFTLDDIEDVKMAIGEASALVLADATPGGDLIARFFLSDDNLTVEVSADVVGPTMPDPSSFTWQVLEATAGDAAASITADRLVIRVSLASSTTSSAS